MCGFNSININIVRVWYRYCYSIFIGIGYFSYVKYIVFYGKELGF